MSEQQTPAQSLSDHDPEQQVVVMMSDMVQYSQRTSGMSPDELKDFIIDYHHALYSYVHKAENQPVDIEPSSGDGSLVVFKKRADEDDKAICRRALKTAIQVAYAIEDGHLPPTRMGLFLGTIIEAELFGKTTKFSTCFAVANRLEELCGHFGTTLLMDREVARNQDKEKPYLVSIGKFSLTSVLHPMNAFTVYKPGLHGCQRDLTEEQLLEFIKRKNAAMELFGGNLLLGVLPDFPAVRNMLLDVQEYFQEMTGKEDVATFRILEYIRETPHPHSTFNSHGMMLMEKKRDSLGDRLFHLSKQLLKAMDYELYQALVVDTSWEQLFKLEWHHKGSVIIKEGDKADGVYYLDHGMAKTIDNNGRELSTMKDGSIFGEMAYFGHQQKRTATVIAESDAVVRKITTEDFRKLPSIIRIFERIAAAREAEISDAPTPLSPNTSSQQRDKP